MAAEKQLCRSQDAILGGVCAGIANYFSSDTLTVRLLAVLLAFVTAGVIVVPYVILWVVLPLEPQNAAPVDVQPEEVHSSTFGSLEDALNRHAAHCGAQDGDERRRIITGTLCVCAVLLTLAIMTLASKFVRGVMWWQLWPLLLVIMGIMRLILPAKEGSGKVAFILGLVVFVLGVVLLLAFLAPSHDVVLTTPYGREYWLR